MTKKTLCISAALLLSVVIGITLLTQKGVVLSLMANGADDVLRPLIGSKATLQLESLYFNASDKLNQVHVPEPVTTSDTFFVDNSQDNPASQLKTQMNLTALTPITHLSRLANEGVWKAIHLSRFPQDEVMAKTVLRVDDNRPYAYVALVKIDQKKIGIGAVAGIKHPGGTIGNPGPGKVPDDIKDKNLLLAAFDGGFQYKDGAYGMIVDGKTYVPLQNNLATVFINTRGQAKIGVYTGEKIPNEIVAVRQNGVLMVKDGQVTPFTEEGKDTWGRTVTNSIYTWRSGIGIDKDGNLIYAVGPSLHPETLAQALRAAGAVNAMQLDINPYWVRFALFQPKNDGTYTATSLLKQMQNGGYTYLHGYQKDFFYLFSKT